MTPPAVTKRPSGQQTVRMADDEGLRIVPADQVSWSELREVFGDRGPAWRCQCQRYKLARREAFARFPVEERMHRLQQQTGCGQTTGATSGLVARRDGVPVGWCAVEPRPRYGGLVRNAKVPWEGRAEDKEDRSVWAVTCVLARAGHRRSGVGSALVRATVGFAREGGARALEGYPMTTTQALAEELHPGLVSMFLAAGFREVSRPTPRRAVVRVDF